MKALRKFCPWPPTEDSQTLLDTFAETMFRKEGVPVDDDQISRSIEDVDESKEISRRMYEYLKFKSKERKDLRERGAKKSPLDGKLRGPITG
jgi:hypothetical protein